jgi:hypothetical protein
VGGDVANMAEKRSTYKVWIGKSEGWRSLGRVRCRCEHNLKDCNKVGWEGVDWICLAWGRDKW